MGGVAETCRKKVQEVSPRASLLAELAKDLPAVRETLVPFLHWEDPLEKEIATHSNTLAWKNLMD